jgi:hypothetical protein
MAGGRGKRKLGRRFTQLLRVAAVIIAAGVTVNLLPPASSAPAANIPSPLLESVSLPIIIIPPEEQPAGASRASETYWLSSDYARGDSRLFSIVAAGDLMMGTAYPSDAGLNPALTPDSNAAELLGEDLAQIFRRADIAFVNLEGTLFDGPNGPAKRCRNCYAFRSPTSYARILQSLGIDVVSLANNHSGDFGPAGRASTVRSLAEAGIASAGLVREARTASLTLIDGRRVGIAAFSPNIGTFSLNDLAGAQRLVRGLTRTSDFVFVSFHGGAEGWDATRVPAGTEFYLGENRGAVERFAHRMIDAGATMVVGHGPHVPRAMEIYRGRLIAYSLGNFWTHGAMMNYAVSGLGPVVEAWIAPDGTLAGVTLHSTRQAGLGLPHLDPLGEAARYVLYLTRSRYPATERMLAGAAPELAQIPLPLPRPQPIAGGPAAARALSASER